MKDYQRLLRPGFTAFDPLELARETEKIVTRKGKVGPERKYVGIYSAPVYRGIATGYAAGCCLRCIYCWSSWSRDYPEKFGRFYSAKEVAQKLSRYPLFILETNGILLGTDRDYVKELAKFKKLYVRVSFKAATPEGFTQRTGGLGSYYELPFKALEYLLDEGIDAQAAAMTDPRVMPEEERGILIEKLSKIDPRISDEGLEEEEIDSYNTTVQRLKALSDPEFASKLEKYLTVNSSK